MKSDVLKKFLSGVSVAVISLLATTSSSLAHSSKTPVAKRTLLSSSPQPVSKGKQSFGVSGKQSLFLSRGSQSLVSSLVASPKKGSRLGGQSLVPPVKQSLLSSRGNQLFASAPVVSRKGGNPLRGQSLVSPVQQSLLSSRGNQLFASAPVASPKGGNSLRGQSLVSPVKQSLPSSRGNQPLVITPVASPKGGNSLRGQSLVSPVKQSLLSSRGNQPLAITPVGSTKRGSLFGRQSLLSPIAQTPSLKSALSVIENQTTLNQQEVDRQQIVRQRHEAWNRFMETPFGKTTTPLSPDELRWVLVGRQGPLFGIVLEGLRGLPQQTPETQLASELVETLVDVTTVRQALAPRDATGAFRDNFDVPARVQAYRNHIAAIEEIRDDLVHHGVDLPPQLVAIRDQLVQYAPIVREALNAPNVLDLFGGRAQLRGHNVARSMSDMQDALEDLNTQVLDLLMTPRALQQLQRSFANNGRVLQTLDALNLTKRIADVFTIRDIDQRTVALQRQPVREALQNLNIQPHNGRIIQRDFLDVLSPAVDLGYQGPGRTLQYGNTGQGLNLPKAPAFHLYNPNDFLRDGCNAPAFTLNLKLPAGYNNPDFAPAALNVHLQGRDPNTIDYFLVVQDVPWDLARGPLLFRPQSWLDPNASYSDNATYWREFPARVGVFSRGGQPVLPLIQGQVEGQLLNATALPHREIVVHNGRGAIQPIDVNLAANGVLRERAQRNEVLTPEERGTVDTMLLNLARVNPRDLRAAGLTDPEIQYVRGPLGWTEADPDRRGTSEIVSSGNVHALVNFNMDQSQDLCSLTEDINTGRMAVTKHVFLRTEHNDIFERVLKLPGVRTYRDIQRELRQEEVRNNRIPLRGGGTMADLIDRL